MAKVGTLKIEYWVPGRIKPYPKNARAHPPEQVAKLVQIIRDAILNGSLESVA